MLDLPKILLSNKSKIVLLLYLQEEGTEVFERQPSCNAMLKTATQKLCQKDSNGFTKDEYLKILH